MSDSTTTQQRNKALVQDRFAAWANGTGSPFELLAEDATWTITGRSAASKTYVGRETFRARSSGHSTPACRRRSSLSSTTSTPMGTPS